MRLKPLAIAAGVLLVAVIAAIAIAFQLLDPRSFAVSLAASVKTDTGRELSLGEVEVTLLPRPALVLSDLRFANAAWGSRPWLAQVGRARVEFDVLALLARRLRIKHVDLTEASLYLETDRRGKGNWVTGSADAGTPAWLATLQIEGLTLQSLAFTYRDGATGKTTSVQLDAVRIDAPSAQDPLRLSARGTFAGKPVEAAGTIGALQALLANAPDYPVDLEGKIGAAGVSLRGSIDEPRALGLMKLALSAQTAQPAELAALFGAKLPPLAAFRGSAQLIGPAAAPALLGIEAMLGGRGTPEIRLSGAVADLRAGRGIDLKLAASAKQPWRIGTAASAARLPPFRASARLRDTQQGYRMEEIELKIAVDGTANASLQVVQGGQLAIMDGRLNASALNVTLGGAKVTLDGSVADPKKFAGLELGVGLQGSELAELFKFFGASIPPVGPYQGRARMQGSLDVLRLTAIEARAGRPGQEAQVSGQIDDALRWQGIQLAIKANVGDSAAAGRLFGAELPRLPASKLTTRLAEAPGGYVLDDLKLVLGRTSLQGRVAYARADERPRVTADLSGPLMDLSELPPIKPKPGGTDPLLAADVEANIRFDRVVLPSRRTLGPVSGGARLANGALELKQFTVAVDGASATLEGRLGDPLAPAALDLMVSIQVAHAAGLEAIAGQRLPIVPAFTASGKLTDVADGYAFAGVKIAHAATIMNGDIAVTRGAKRLKVTAKAASPLLDVSALMQLSEAGGAAKPKGAGERSAAKPKAAGARAIPDLPLPLNVLRAIDADLDLRFDAVKMGEAAPLGALSVRAAIADGRLKAEPVQLAVEAGQALNLSASIDSAPAAWEIRIDGKGIGLGELLARLGHPGVVTGGSTDLGIRLQGRGKSVTAILGSLNGDARVAVGALRVHNVAINLEGGLVPRLFALANPFHKTDPDTDVKCFAASVPVRNGVLSSERNIALETAKYNLVASGTVNLRTERIDMALTPVVRSEAGTGVRLGGTLAAPEVGIDAIGVAKSATSLGAVVVAPALLIADSLIRKAASDPNPCATALARPGN